MQNKLHYAAHGHTAAEIIAGRADAAKPNMGLTAFAGEQPRKSDVSIAKNYLDADELRRLSTLVSAYFDAAEFRAQSRQPTYMKDWLVHLDALIVAMGGQSLADAGSVSHRQAVTKAEAEYERFKAQIDAGQTDVERSYLDMIKQAQREVEKTVG